MNIIKSLAVALLLFSLYSSAAIINVDSGTTGCTLHDAIRAANANTVIGGCSAGSNTNTPDNIVLPDTFSLVLNNELPTVTSPVTIRTATPSGQATINGDSSYRCFHFQDAQNVTLENITLINGQTTQNASIVNISNTGSGILLQNSQLTLENVSIISNIADAGFGAGIAAYSSTLNLDNVNFNGNKFLSFGGIYGLGAHLYARQSTININNSTFESFTPYPYIVAANGSAIFIAGSDVNISGSTFKNNPTDYYGATIAIQDLVSDPTLPGASTYENASLLIKNSTFFNTQSWFSGEISLAAIVAAKESSNKDVNVTLRNVTMYKSGEDLSITPDSFSATQISIYPQVNFSSSNSLFVFGQSYNSCFASFDNANWSVDINNSFPDDACNFTTSGGNPTTNFTLYGNVQDNGGLTETIKLRPLDYSFTPPIENLAFNAGDSATCEPYDQRGILRQMPCEQGAYEVDDVADIGVQVQLITQGPYYFGQTLKYQISVSNDGPAFAYGVDLSLATNTITFVEYDSVYSCSGSSCQIIFIPNNSSAEITLYAQINNVQNFDLGASVAFASNSISDINLTNNTDNNGDATVNASDLEITQTLNTSPPYFIGQVLEYNITVKNLGNSQAQNISISHPVLDGINAVSHSNCDSSNANTCNISTLNNGSSRSVLFYAEVVANKIENQTEVTNTVYDPKLRNNTATNKNNVATNSNLKIAVSKLTAAPHYQAQSLQFAVDILNSGPDQASNVTINNTYDNMVVIGVSNQCNGILPCVIPSIAVNETVTILYTSTLFTEDFNINTIVTADQNDDDFSDNVDGFSGSIVNDADILIGVNLISQPPYYRNSTIDLELVVANYGSHDASDVNISISNLNNLQISHVESESCVALPCNIIAISNNSYSYETIQIQAFIPNIGDFSITANVNASEYDPILNNNQSSLTETALQTLNSLIFKDGFE